MKKQNIFTIISILFTPLLFISCGSTSKIQSNTDSYSSPETKESIQKNEDERIAIKNNAKGKQKNKKSALESFFSFGNGDKYIELDGFNILSGTITGALKEKESTLYINTEKKTAGFGSPYMSAYYITQFSNESRKKLAEAVNNYLSDFENKRLDRKDKKSFKKYGTLDIHLDWGSIKSSTPNNAEGRAFVGYIFEKNSPFFTITIYPLHNNYWDIVGDSTAKESLNLKYCFTKSLAKDMVDNLSDDNILSYFDFSKIYDDYSDYDDYSNSEEE